MTNECTSAISRHLSPEFCIVCLPSRNQRAQGRPGASRTRGPFAHQQERAHEHTGTGGASRPSLRNGFTAHLVLSPENGSFASVACERLSPPADLMPAPRHQDHTTSPYTASAHVCHAISVHRIPPRVRDVRERPLIGRDGRSYAGDLGENGSGIFLRGGVDVISGNPK